VVVDALSQKYEDEGSLFSLSFIVENWLNEVHKECFIDPNIVCLIQQLQMEPHASQGYTWKNEELLYKGRIYLNNLSTFKSSIM
jgi:hypothetical protein